MKVEISAILLLSSLTIIVSKSLDIQKLKEANINDIDNDIIDFDDTYSVKYDKKYEVLPWDENNFHKDNYKYTIVKQEKKIKDQNADNNKTKSDPVTESIQKTTELNVIPLELLSTTESVSASVTEHTLEPDLTVIPLSSTQQVPLKIIINQTVTIPPSTELSEDFNSTTVFYEMTTKGLSLNDSTENSTAEITTNDKYTFEPVTSDPVVTYLLEEDSTEPILAKNKKDDLNETISIVNDKNETISDDNSTATNNEVPVLTEEEVEDLTEVPEDYYDSKDIIPTPAPKTDTLSVIFGFAGSVVESVVESVAERVVPKSIYDLFKRMQRQSELLEAEKLRSKEENGGIGNVTYVISNC